MLELVDLHTYYGDSYVLQGLSLNVGEGSVVALLGRNGMGKTTTIRSIIGFNPPRRGTIHFKGQEITRAKSHRIARLGIGLVPQGRQIFPSLSVRENLSVSARAGRGCSSWDSQGVYSLFPVLRSRARNKGNQLSGGEQQMLAIGRALMTNPDLLLMDEPSEGLAPVIVSELTRTIALLKDRGHSILLVEQNLSMALELADYVYVIDRGQIVYEALPEEFKGNAEIQAKYLGVTG